MKRALVVLCTLGITSFLQAQQTQGRVVYDHKSLGAIETENKNAPYELILEKHELLFGNDRSIIKILPNKQDDPDMNKPLAAVCESPVSNQIFFSNLKTGEWVACLDIENKTYLIADTISKLLWTLTGETKTILGHKCQKATAKRISNHLDASAEERAEDEVIVWFAPSIPVAAGPENLQAQLPGLILELILENGTRKYTAIELEEAVDLSLIKEPKDGMWTTAMNLGRILNQVN